MRWWVKCKEKIWIEIGKYEEKSTYQLPAARHDLSPGCLRMVKHYGQLIATKISKGKEGKGTERNDVTPSNLVVFSRFSGFLVKGFERNTGIA